MFKKRGQTSKNANLSMQLESITTTIFQHNQQNKPKFSTTIEVEKDSDCDNRISGSSTYQIFDTIMVQQQQSKHPKQYSYEQRYQQRIQDQMQEQKLQNPMLQQIIQISNDQSQKQPQTILIEDDNGNNVEILEVIEDISGGLQIDNDFEDQIIKKALTRQNYLKFKKQQRKQQPQSKQMKLIKKINRESVMQSIDKQINKHKTNIFDMKQRIEYHKQSAINIVKKVKPKILANEQNIERLDKIKKILKLIYYRASEIRQFTMEGLLQQVQEEQQHIIG